MKNFCIRKLFRTDQRIQIRYPYPHHTPLTYRTRAFPPLRVVCPIITRSRKNFPDEFVLNMKVVQNESTSTDTISTCLLVVSNTADMEPSPPDHRFGNQPVLTNHHRINSRSEPNTLY